MPEPRSNLGKLIAIHSTSPQFLQRAAIVAVLSFIFFLGSFIFYLIWQSFLYFLLSTSFLIVQLFTIIGWWMQKRGAVHIYANGIAYRKRELKWGEITGVELTENRRLKIVPTAGNELLIPSSIQGLDRVEGFVAEHLS